MLIITHKPLLIMKATFHSLRGEKSALIMIRKQFSFSAQPVYVPRVDLPSDIEEGQSFDIPDNLNIVDLVDFETGEVRTTKNGEPLKTLG